MSSRATLLIPAVLCVVFFATSPAHAQFGRGSEFSGENANARRSLRPPEVPRSPAAPRAKGVGGVYLSQYDTPPAQKPFANYSPAPTVSPYVNLEQDNQNFSLPTYQTLVRPFVEQRDFNQRQQVELQRINQQFQKVRTQFEMQNTQSQLRPTGHGVYFNNLLHYYPGR